jgi:hypothetical protein
MQNTHTIFCVNSYCLVGWLNSKKGEKLTPLFQHSRAALYSHEISGRLRVSAWITFLEIQKIVAWACTIKHLSEDWQWLVISESEELPRLRRYYSNGSQLHKVWECRTDLHGSGWRHNCRRWRTPMKWIDYVRGEISWSTEEECFHRNPRKGMLDKFLYTYIYNRAAVFTDSISAVYHRPPKNWKIKEINGL